MEHEFTDDMRPVAVTVCLKVVCILPVRGFTSFGSASTYVASSFRSPRISRITPTIGCSLAYLFSSSSVVLHAPRFVRLAFGSILRRSNSTYLLNPEMSNDLADTAFRYLHVKTADYSITSPERRKLRYELYLKAFEQHLAHLRRRTRVERPAGQLRSLVFEPLELRVQAPRYVGQHTRVYAHTLPFHRRQHGDERQLHLAQQRAQPVGDGYGAHIVGEPQPAEYTHTHR